MCGDGCAWPRANLWILSGKWSHACGCVMLPKRRTKAPLLPRACQTMATCSLLGASGGAGGHACGSFGAAEYMCCREPVKQWPTWRREGLKGLVGPGRGACGSFGAVGPRRGACGSFKAVEWKYIAAGLSNNGQLGSIWSVPTVATSLWEMAKCSLLERYNRGSKYNVLLPAVEVEVCAQCLTMETMQTKSVEKLRSTEKVVPGAAPAMAGAGSADYHNIIISKKSLQNVTINHPKVIQTMLAFLHPHGPQVSSSPPRSAWRGPEPLQAMLFGRSRCQAVLRPPQLGPGGFHGNGGFLSHGGTPSHVWWRFSTLNSKPSIFG